LRVLLDHYAYANPAAITRVIKARAPWLTDDAEKEALLEETVRFPRRWTAQSLGIQLNLSQKEHLDLNIRTIGPLGVVPGQQKLLRKLRDRAKKERKRRAIGIKPRDQYLAECKSRLKPWEAAGMSRRTWYRRLKKSGTGLSPIYSSIAGGHTCATEQAVTPQQGIDGSELSFQSEPGPSLPEQASRQTQTPEVSESCDAGPVSVAMAA
jgi:hypothetical protein